MSKPLDCSMCSAQLTHSNDVIASTLCHSCISGETKNPEEDKPVEPNALRIDLACGDSKREGFLGVDKYKTSSTDIVADLSERWPFEDNSVDEAHSSHYIEHVVDLCHFWSELHRVMKVGGRATIIAPYGKNNRAWQDPTHCRAIVEESFYYLDKNFRKVNRLEHYLADVDFEFTVAYIGIDPMWTNRNEQARAFAIRHYWNVVADLQAVLTKRPSE